MIMTLVPYLEAMIQEKIVNGNYDDANEVVPEALRLLDERERLNRLRAKLASGLAQIKRGVTVPYTADFMERLKREAAEHVRAEAAIKAAVEP